MFKNHKTNLIIIFVLSLILGWQFFRPGFYSMHDDLQVMRLFEMNRCFMDGQIPCRWSPDMGSGYGQPMFNYYSVFPYYLGTLFHELGLSFVDTTKILFFLSLLGTGVFSYLFFSEILSLPAALAGAVVYLIVPYHAVDIFVRGAMSEAWALTLIPLVLFFIVKTIKTPKISNAFGLSFAVGMFLTTHNISSMISLFIFVPFTVIYILISKTPVKKLGKFFLGGVLGVGLSAFFTLPIALERGLVQTNFLTQDYYDFHAHFVTIRQLFLSLFWGYGGSVLGPEDGLSLAVGILQTAGLVLLPLLFFIFRKKVDKKIFILGSTFWALALFNIFMTHSRSVFIWDKLPFLSYVQFPWRFLGMVSICTATVYAFVTYLIPQKISNFFILVTFILLMAINFRFYRFDKYYPNIGDTQKLSGQEFTTQQRSALLDYLPIYSKVIPQTIAPSQPLSSDKTVNINYFDHRSNYFASEFDVYVDNVTITFPVVYFPGWQIFHDRSGTQYPYSYDNDLGLITVKLNKGHHLVQGFLENTPARTIGNTVTFTSFLIILILMAISYENKKH